MCRSRLSLTKIAHQMWWAKETWKQKEQWKWGWRWQGSWGWWKTLQKGGIGNIRGFSWNKGVSTPLSTMSRDFFPSPPPSTKFSTSPHLDFPAHYSQFLKTFIPPLSWGGGGGWGRGGEFKLWSSTLDRYDSLPI